MTSIEKKAKNALVDHFLNCPPGSNPWDLSKMTEAISDACVEEIQAVIGKYDWLLDAEHVPFEVRDMVKELKELVK